MEAEQHVRTGEIARKNEQRDEHQDERHNHLYRDYLITLSALTTLIGEVESVAAEHGIDSLYAATKKAREKISE